MAYDSFNITIKDYIAHLVINRPNKSNSLDVKAWEEMQQAFIDLDQDPKVRVIILSGEGKHFCAGMDMNALMSLQQEATTDCEAKKRELLRAFILKIQGCISQIEVCRKPVLAAIHGGCIGGGVDLVTACDMRYASEDAFFTIKEIDLGIVADIGTLQRLPTIIHPGLVAELAYTGRKVFGEEAAAIGLTNKVFSDKAAMMEYVQGIAANIAAKSPLCIRGIKEMILYKRDHSVDDSLKNMANYNAGMLISKDLTVAMMAQMTKQQAEFED